jgi:hypothetical protein
LISGLKSLNAIFMTRASWYASARSNQSNLTSGVRS